MTSIQKELQRVVCAAIRSIETGKIVCGARHYDSIMRNQISDEEEWQNVEQGFIDQFCNFLTREEAFEIAKKNGQIFRRCGGDEGRLFSENLY